MWCRYDLVVCIFVHVLREDEFDEAFATPMAAPARFDSAPLDIFPVSSYSKAIICCFV